MKKTITTGLLAILIVSCGGKENSQSIEALIETKNVKELQAKKTLIQADLAKIDDALASLNIKEDEALVSVETLKDTTFNHYLEIQGSVNTKENI